MWFRFLADLLVLGHLGFILFAVFGGLLVLRWKRVIWLHLPAVSWTVIVELCPWYCPLTSWENHLRMLGGYRGQKAMGVLLGGALSILITFQLFGFLPDSQKSMHRYTDDGVVPMEGQIGG